MMHSGTLASRLPERKRHPRQVDRESSALFYEVAASIAKTAQALLADALQLDVKTRADLAAELLASLDGPADADAEQAWAAEIERRTASLEAGTEPVESWDDTKRRIERDILGR